MIKTSFLPSPVFSNFVSKYRTHLINRLRSTPSFRSFRFPRFYHSLPLAESKGRLITPDFVLFAHCRKTDKTAALAPSLRSATQSRGLFCPSGSLAGLQTTSLRSLVLLGKIPFFVFSLLGSRRASRLTLMVKFSSSAQKTHPDKTLFHFFYGLPPPISFP